MRNENHHAARPERLWRLPVALCRLFYPTGELQEYITLVVDEEHESAAGTDNQTEDKCAHSFAPPDAPDYIQIRQLNLPEKTSPALFISTTQLNVNPALVLHFPGQG
jgi:hypothetical protein